MTDKEYREQKQRIKALFSKWHILGLGWFRVHYEWDRARCMDEPMEAMKTEVSWQYREVTFTVRLPACQELDDDHLEHIVVHECAHALTGGFMAQLDLTSPGQVQIMEHATEMVANAIIWSREAGKRDTLKAGKKTQKRG